MQPLIRAKQRLYKLIGIRRKAKLYLLQRREWHKSINKELEMNHDTLKNLLMMQPTLRKSFDWLVNEFNDLAEEKAGVIKRVAEELFEYIRSIHILDVHRWNMMNEDKVYKIDRVEKLVNRF